MRDAQHRLDPLWDELFPAEQVRIVRTLVDRVVVGPGGADIRLRVEGAGQGCARSGAGGCRAAEGCGMSATATHITVQVALAIRKRPGRNTVVMPVHHENANAVTTRADPALVKAVARAFRYQRLLDDGGYGSVTEMAAAEKIERGYLGTLLRLTLLAPDIVQDILDGRQPAGTTLPKLFEALPVGWEAQRQTFAGN